MSNNSPSVAASTYEDILECMSEALIFADVEGIIRIWNPGAEAIFGYSAAEALDQNLDLIVPENLRKAHWNGYHRATEMGATVHGRRSFVTRSLHKSGQQLYVDMSFAIIKNQAGVTIGSAAIARDATARHLDDKAMRRQLAELTAKSAG